MGSHTAGAIGHAAGAAAKGVGALGAVATKGAGVVGEAVATGAEQVAPLAAAGASSMKHFMESAAHGAHASVSSLMDAVENMPIAQATKAHTAPIRRSRNATPPPIPPEHYPTTKEILGLFKDDLDALRSRIIIHPSYLEAIKGWLGDALTGLRGKKRSTALQQPLDGLSPEQLAELLAKLGQLKK